MAADARRLEADLEYLRERGSRAASTSTGPSTSLIADDRVAGAAPRGSPTRALRADEGRARAAGSGLRRRLHVRRVRRARGASFAGFARGHGRPGIACAPSVGPGYNASRATPDHRVRSRRAGKTYDEMWRAAIAAEPDRVTITSYNEWHEGTQIEAARRRPRSDATASYESYEGAYGRTGRAGRAGVPRPHGVLDEDVPRRRGGHRGAEAGQSVPVRLAAAQRTRRRRSS